MIRSRERRNRLREASVEEQLVLENGSADAAAEIIQLDDVSRQPVGIVDPGVGIERRIAEVFEEAAVKSICAPACNHADLQ